MTLVTADIMKFHALRSQNNPTYSKALCLHFYAASFMWKQTDHLVKTENGVSVAVQNV
jgi:hypothetical protein